MIGRTRAKVIELAASLIQARTSWPAAQGIATELYDAGMLAAPTLSASSDAERDELAGELYTPTNEEMRRSATEFDFRHSPKTFDRWLASVRADAIRFEADRVNDRPAGTDARAWLLARAAAGQLPSEPAPELEVRPDAPSSEAERDELARLLFAEEQCDRRQREDVEGNWLTRLNDADQAEYLALADAILTSPFMAARDARMGREAVLHYMKTKEVARIAIDSIEGTPVAEYIAKVRREGAAKALRDFADATRFPSDWILFRRDDGSGVTVGDLLHETADRLAAEHPDAQLSAEREDV